VYERTGTGIIVDKFFMREKWELASKRTGSGNTTNIGSISNLDMIMNRESVFENEEDFNSYWTSYARKIKSIDM
jgi:hypothetical protein